MEDYSIIIKSICQDLYENLRLNSSSFFSNAKLKKYLKKIKHINKKTDYRYIENIRDELGFVYKKYLIFSRKQDLINNSKILKRIKKMYIEMCYVIEQFILGNTDKYSYKEYKNIEIYINELSESYGGQTEKYLKKLLKQKLGNQKKQIKKICNNKSMIISEKKKEIIKVLQSKLNEWNAKFGRDESIEITYNSKNAEYIFIKKKNENLIKKKKYKFNTKFSDIEQLQKNAIKNLRKMNFGISIYEELLVNQECYKYIDPFILTIFITEGYLDYSKIYISQLNLGSKNDKYKLPFKIKYTINQNFNEGILTPIRNEIIAIIAERNSLSVAEVQKIKNKKINEKREDINVLFKAR